MRKLATMLFADLVESTARVGTLDPEEARALMGDFFEAMAAEIAAEGGVVEKYVGDAIMAVFGVPAAHEDDRSRRSGGRRMLARLAVWNAAREPAPPLDIRIGIDTGEVLAPARRASTCW
jgi:class 3 adenylate cyclase